MGTLMVRCARTGQDFSSGIETDSLSFERMPAFNATIRCPLCGIDHTWSKIDAWVREGELARSSSNDARTEGAVPDR
jgi:hypothetical protein